MTAKSFNKAMGAEIRKERLAHGWTQKAIAKRVGFKYQQQGKYEAGTNGYSAAHVAELATIFQTPVAELYERVRISIKAKAIKPSPAEDDAFLAARYMSRIKSAWMRRWLIHTLQKAAYEGRNAA